MRALPKMGFGEAVKTCFKKYACFSGRARRSEYWWWVLFMVIVGICGIIPILGWILIVATILPSYAVMARRLHDVGHTGWWILAPLAVSVVNAVLMLKGMSNGTLAGVLSLVSLVIGVAMLIWLVKDSQKEDNEYGPSPKYVAE